MRLKMRTADLVPPELLDPDGARIIPGCGQVGQHNYDESEGRLRLGLKVAPQPYCTQAPG